MHLTSLDRECILFVFVSTLAALTARRGGREVHAMQVDCQLGVLQAVSVDHTPFSAVLSTFTTSFLISLLPN